MIESFRSSENSPAPARGPRFAAFILLPAALWVALPAPAAEPVPNRAPLQASEFYPLPLGSVKPRGWLRDQLKLQATGITGRLDEFWPDVGPNSAWLGGSGEGWERGPYYLDGLLPLAYLLDDPKLIAKAKPWVEWTLANQRSDGSIGPAANRDWWPLMIMLKVLTQYQEATGDARVIPAMSKFFAYHASMMDKEPLKSWAIYRWQDELASIIWLYNRTGDVKLLDLAKRLQGQGHDWLKHFDEFKYKSKIPRNEAGLITHGVNNAMGLKTHALWCLISGDPRHRTGVSRAIRTLDSYHGLANGMFSADEHFAGTSPSQGIELCAVVEAMFSIELALGVSGEVALGDRLEKIAYNALPGTQTADLSGHQYDQQPNQVLCTLGHRDWTTNGPESNTFGLEPNFGCCTANLHQGWPKFAASLWMASREGGLVAAAYGPSEVSTTINGVAVRVVETTDYPFRDRVVIEVNPASPLRFPITVRIPEWTASPVIAVNGAAAATPKAGTFHRIDMQWKRGDRIEITLPMPIRVVEGFNRSVSVERGPLVYSLRVGENWSKIRQNREVTDWEVYPSSAWNYGLRIDTANPAASFKVVEAPIGPQPFISSAPPVVINATGRRIPEWVIVNGSAAPPPASPVLPPSHPYMTGKLTDEPLTLIPYGAARLRITSFPVMGPDPVPAK